MHSRRKDQPGLSFLLNSADQFGRSIDAVVLEVTGETAQRAVSYGERVLGDPALALTLFEESAAAVSQAIRNKVSDGDVPIRDLRRYHFRAYLNQISEARRRQPQLETGSEEDWRKYALEAMSDDFKDRAACKRTKGA